MAVEISTKRLAISKANGQMVAIVAVASFVSIFCLVATQAVWSQNKYQAKVITEKEKARNQLKDNLEAYNGLVKSYKKFDNASTNIIGGNRDGSTDRDGNSSKIVLDALPSEYDFPALASSVEKTLASVGVKASSIGGTDDGTANTEASPTPKAAEIPFSFTITDANYNTIQKVNTFLKASIRPIQVDSIIMTGGGDKMSATFTAHTFYQPAKSVKITTKVIK